MDWSFNPAKTGVTVLVSPGCAQVALDSLSCEKCIGHQVIIRSCLSYIFYPRYHNYIYAKHWCFDLQVKNVSIKHNGRFCMFPGWQLVFEALSHILIAVMC